MKRNDYGQTEAHTASRGLKASGSDEKFDSSLLSIIFVSRDNCEAVYLRQR